jgi:holliday junction DNA helicase RuvA
MIASIHGEVASLGDNSLIVRVGGVGLRIYVPAGMREAVQVGESISLHTHLVVREDALTLFGFDTQDERDFFLLLLGANGVGPRIALAILSSLSLDVIRKAVLSEQADVFCRAPGVGKKLAQKIIIHLQGKVGDISFLRGEIFLDVNQEILEALTRLGYSVVEAQSALQSLPRDAPQDLEERLRLALQYFS